MIRETLSSWRRGGKNSACPRGALLYREMHRLTLSQETANSKARIGVFQRICVPSSFHPDPCLLFSPLMLTFLKTRRETMRSSLMLVCFIKFPSFDVDVIRMSNQFYVSVDMR